MSDTSKRPGARDISDLKARLGLKKGGAAGTGAGGPVAQGNRAGVVAPPGARGGIPAPPGAQPPQPARPAIPDAHHDPFGAMNAMAAHGAVAAQPQIVIVNDGQPVESVEHKRGGLKMAIVAAAILVPLIIGSVVGKIAAQNNAFNSAISDAGKLRDDVKVIGKGMLSIQQVLQLGKERGPGGHNFLTNDEKLIQELESLTLIEPAFDLLSQLQLSAIGDVLAKETMELYSETARLNKAIKEHIARSKSDQKALREGADRARGVYGYGAIVQLPAGDAAAQGAPVVVRLAQLGQPVCQGETKPSDKPCSGPPIGFQYRLEDGGPFGVAKVSSGAVGDGQMVLLDPGSKVLDGLVKGGGALVAEVAYQTRIRDISEKVDLLVELRKNVETKLNNVANRATRPTFFL